MCTLVSTRSPCGLGTSRFEFAGHTCHVFAAMHTGLKTAILWSGLLCCEYSGESLTAFVEWVALLCDARVQSRVFDRICGLNMQSSFQSRTFFDVRDAAFLRALDGQ